MFWKRTKPGGYKNTAKIVIMTFFYFAPNFWVKIKPQYLDP